MVVNNTMTLGEQVIPGWGWLTKSASNKSFDGFQNRFTKMGKIDRSIG